MHYKTPGACPICQHKLTVTKLSCKHCQTKLEGDFQTCKFCQLSTEHREFIEVFIKCRGNIRDVEKELGISYPTVRSRLDSLIEALGYNSIKKPLPPENHSQQAILAALERGELTPDEAAEKLRNLE